MSAFLEELKSRLADAQKRFQAAQYKTQLAQAELQAISQEFGSLQHLVTVETAKAQKDSGEVASTDSQAISQPALAQGVETNKTEAIRELLRQHPAGMTPTDIWKQVKNQMAHRAYLYSILKRLKDKDEVTVRRGKYVAKMSPKSEERAQALLQ